MSTQPLILDVNLFGNCKSIIYLNAEVPNHPGNSKRAKVEHAGYRGPHQLLY